jgi:phosphoglycolate phosphatase-like HAD superfamily hydrolase
LEHVRQVKPHPEAVLSACAQLGVPPEQALMVGDTPDDMAAGRAAGASTIGVTTGAYDRAALLEAGAQEVLATLAELPSLVA